MKFITLIVLFFPLAVYCQPAHKVHIRGQVKSDKLRTFNFYKFGISDDLYTNHLDTSIPITPFKPFEFDIEIPHKGMYAIGDGMLSVMTHSIFLRPGDTINLTFIPLPDYEAQLKSDYAVFTRHTMHVEARYPGNLTYFDSLPKLVSGKILKHEMLYNKDPLHYKASCDSAYEICLTLLNEYIREKKVSPDFISYAKAELSARYVSWLTGLSILIPRDQIPDSYFSGADTLSFNDPVYACSLGNYVNAAGYYNHYIYNNFDPGNKYANLKNELHTIMQNYSGIVRDELMGEEIMYYLGKGNPAFDSVYHVFLMQCQNRKMKQYVMNKVEAYKLIPKHVPGKRPEWKDVLEGTVVFTKDDHKFLLKQVLADDKLYVIDCWATWCGPCKEQIPAVKAFEKSLKDSVQFISLSFDQDGDRWKNFLEKDKNLPPDQYRIYSRSDSVFMNYFSLNSIPRFILVSKYGNQVLEADMPRPSFSDQFTRVLHKYLNDSGR